jgi:ADP-heptose:LPS heptosyltransferase
VKPKLLIIELWGLGDLVIATPFVRAAAEKYELTLLAKPYAADLKLRLWPQVEVVPFNAPWTAFKGKYHFWRWPWAEIIRLQSELAGRRFDFGLSGRWDPRDHLLLKCFGVQNRIGFPRMRSQTFLTQPLSRPSPLAHHYDYWRSAGKVLGIEMPPVGQISNAASPTGSTILVHSGARLPARVWPMANYQQVVLRLRDLGHEVQVACDSNQLAWWQKNGERDVVCPQTVTELFSVIDQARAFVGNCSGPGHLAAICGVPTFTLYGPSLHEWFAPLHPQAEMFEGKACPYKPCSDYCRFATPRCLWDVTVDEVWPKLERFVGRPVPRQLAVKS